jgi:ABC-type polysaccharide/polyol phosphate transport system ATPase subunit
VNAKIALQSVTLARRTQEEYSYDLKRVILRMIEGKHKRPRKRRVIDNVSIDVGAGEKVGIIGSNGSGKSTLLKLICGILRPTSGKVRVDGTISPLIELGAGFDGEITVIANIIYYGVLLGYTRSDIESRVKSILDFAELHDHAHEPLKTLSSGMNARLGFAIATETRPDILILDEVLAVGDERFREKCSARIRDFWDANSTILVVTHDMDFVRNQCSRAIWMDRGRVKLQADPNSVVDAYLDAVRQHKLTPA